MPFQPAPLPVRWARPPSVVGDSLTHHAGFAHPTSCILVKSNREGAIDGAIAAPGSGLKPLRRLESPSLASKLGHPLMARDHLGVQMDLMAQLAQPVTDPEVLGQVLATDHADLEDIIVHPR